MRMKQGQQPHGTKWKEHRWKQAFGCYVELWLHVLLRIFLGLTCGYVYCVVFEICDVSELWLQVEGVQVRCLGVDCLCILV